MRLIFIIFVFALVACAATPKDIKPAPESPMRAVDVIWGKSFVENGTSQFLKNSPVVDADVVYLADENGRLSCLRLLDGSVVWQKQFDAAWTGGPTLDGDVIAAANINAQVMLLSKKTGQLIWQAEVSSEVLAPPKLSQNVVVVQTNDGKLIGLRRSNGKVLWSFSRSVPLLTLRGTGEPMIVGDKVLAGFSKGQMVAVSINDGKLLWETVIAMPKGRSELERMVDLDGFMAYQDGTLYVASYQGRIAAITEESGRILWARDMSTYTGLSLFGDLLFVSDTEGLVWAMDKNSGATLWKQQALSGLELTRPIIFSDQILVGDADSRLYWLSKADGKLLGRSEYFDISLDAGVNSYTDLIDPDDEYEQGLFMEKRGFSHAPVVTDENLLISYRNGVLALIANATKP
ncbi:MAG: outer membrane protein assembly factor BamB [Gammaproteobacteria bacterium]|nr:outer membrane protein assembly factor BamB [Gammaproteobacteria bacterium]MDH5727735.1 outer membrane protein assembly factor BamB [Gammaproteobacteria bacterium]